jgi:hypothetical protein
VVPLLIDMTNTYHNGNIAHRETTARNSVLQRAWDSSLIISADGGQTWNRSILENTERPMFPGHRFGSPFFIHYGENGASEGMDQSNIYLYAIANDGYWNNGNDMILGRVRKDRVERLDSADWSFYCGGNGMSDENWTQRMEDPAVSKILEHPGRLSQSAVSYIPEIKRYLMVEWHYNAGNPCNMLGGVEYYGWGGYTYLDICEAAHPWGPWHLTTASSLEQKMGWYNPVILPQLTERVGERELKLYALTSGDFASPQTHYKINLIPLLLALA